MRICTPTPLYKLDTPDGPVKISQPRPGDQLRVDYLAPADKYGRRAIMLMLVPIIGWARGRDGQLSLYTPGPDSSKFRLATEEGCEEEYFFAGKVPATLYEHRLDEYAKGTLLYLPAEVTETEVPPLRIAA